MTDVWVVIAVDWEEAYVRAVLTTEEAAIARARAQAEREDYHIVIEKHRLDPGIEEQVDPVVVEFRVPSLGPPGQFIGVRMGSVGIPPS